MVDTTPRGLAAATPIDRVPIRSAGRASLRQLTRRRSTTAFLFATPLLLVVGGLIVISSGLYLLHREAVRKVEPSAPVA